MRNIPFMYQVPGNKDLLYYFVNYPVSSDSSPPFLHAYMFYLLQCLDLASTNFSLVLVLDQFSTLVCQHKFLSQGWLCWG